MLIYLRLLASFSEDMAFVVSDGALRAVMGKCGRRILCVG
jgi:hypothetical protein